MTQLSFPLVQRKRRYRYFTQDALKKADQARNDEFKAQLISMAADWHFLASQAEALSDRYSVARKGLCRRVRA